ncbi:Protein kinase-like domain [Phytophthora cactorum]|nr:Protein kinase-like domain [Phytophthora cactorum]
MRKLDGQFECHRVESSNDKTAIPLVLLNETFARFEQNCKQFEFGNADCDFVLELCGALLFPYEIKEEFAQKAQDLLEGYLIAGYPEATMWPMVDQGSVSHGSYRLGETLLLNLSCRLQKGYGGGDPTMENIAYYIKILPKVIDRQFPCFLLDICGPLMSVYGIVNTGSSDVICEPLVMSFPLIFFRNNWLMESLVRMCASLKAAVKELRDRCFQLGRANEETVSFQYVEHIHRFVFKAKDHTGKEVIIKFAHQYGQQVHELCSNTGFAPVLLFYEILSSGWVFIVPRRRNAVDSTDARAQLLKIQSTLAGASFVREDLREGNVMWDTSGNRVVVVLIDFDWSVSIGTRHF